MAYGTTKVDVIQSSTANVPVQFNDGNGTQIGTLCRAWVNFNGTGTVAIRASFNVSSITDNGTGDYTVNFTTALPDANYGVSVASSSYTTTANSANPCIKGTVAGGASNKTTTQLSVLSYAGNTLYDFAEFNVAVFR